MIKEAKPFVKAHREKARYRRRKRISRRVKQVRPPIRSEAGGGVQSRNDSAPAQSVRLHRSKGFPDNLIPGTEGSR